MSTPIPRAPRSYLFVPGSRPERIGKAIAAGADAVIVDLEDAVAPDDKAAARHNLHAPWPSLRAQADAAGVTLLVRVNGADTAYFGDDLAFCRDLAVAAIVLPKADCAALEALRAVLPDIACYALLETAAGQSALASKACGVKAELRVLRVTPSGKSLSSNGCGPVECSDDVTPRNSCVYDGF